MNVNGIGALTAYTYQNTLAQTGNANQALSQALAASQSQANDMMSLLSGLGSTDPLAAASGTSGLQPLSSLTYSTSAASGNNFDALQALLGSNSPSSNLTSLFTSSDGLSMSAAMLAPDATAALVRYTYDQSQNHTASTPQTTSQAVASAQQTLLTASLNLLA